MSLIYGVISQITVCFNKEDNATQLPDQILSTLSFKKSFDEDLVF
jgi:hypothetical protein